VCCTTFALLLFLVVDGWDVAGIPRLGGPTKDEINLIKSVFPLTDRVDPGLEDDLSGLATTLLCIGAALGGTFCRSTYD